MSNYPSFPDQQPDPGYQGQHQPAYGYAGAEPALLPETERNLGTVAHVIPIVAMVCSAGTMGFLASLIMYFLYRDRGPFVRANVANSLNVQITMVIWVLLSIPLILALGLGFLTMVAAPFVAAALHIVGALKARDGLWWNPPLTPRFFS